MKRLLTLCALLTGLTTQAQLPSYVPTDGLVGYWGFNGNANDESGNGNDGVVNGATLTEDRDGNPNAAYSFDGTDDRIELIPLDLPERTVSLWFRAENEAIIINAIFACDYPSMQNGMTVAHLLQNTLYTELGNGVPDNAIACTEPYQQDIWYNITMVKSLTVAETYLNGALLCSFPSENLNSTANQVPEISNVGCSRLWDRFFNGSIDDIGFWNRALTEEEVLALYNGCSVSIDTIAGDLTPFTLEENTYNCTNTPNSTYEWEVEGGVITSGQGSSTVTVLWAEEGIGTLTVTETTEEGCEGSVSIEVEIVCATTATTIEGPLGPGELLEVTYTCDGDASSTYNWSISNGVITSGQGTNTVTAIWASTGLGSITVQETTSANCAGEEITLDVVVVVATRINETLKESINIFPNPASTSVTISIDESLINASYQLFDARGKLVSEGALTRTNTVLNTTAFASGNYVIFIGNDQGMARQRIIIE